MIGFILFEAVVTFSINRKGRIFHFDMVDAVSHVIKTLFQNPNKVSKKKKKKKKMPKNKNDN